jgi:protein phosphatase
MALVDWPTAYVAHVGDSRCYVCRNGKLHQLTVDHTYANALVESGEMTPEEATHSSFAHAIWNVVGGHDAQIEPSVEVHQLEIGDTLLLCSDGLTNHEQACERLIALANAGGGRDNITLAVARFVDASVLEAQESAADGEVDGQLDPIDLEAAELDFTLSESTIQFLDNSDV